MLPRVPPREAGRYSQRNWGAIGRGPYRCNYARAGIPDYWILDLTGDTLEVCRRPGNGGYEERLVMSADGQVSPLEAPAKAVLVGDLLP